jgi:hypothetical protein
MANTTRLKMANQATPYIRVEAQEDFAEHDSAHTASLASGLGSSADFLLHGDSDTTWGTAHQVISVVSANSINLSTVANGLLIIQFKHTGYKEAAKTNATTATIEIHQNTNDPTRFFGLYPNESIILHAPFGGSSDNANDWALAASDTNGVYVEVITCIGTDDAP